ncbi:MAG: L-threonylcarbamoyladenylate synthase [Bacteroidia bacterium]|nr:L-threonylcarbamoyladenylate synthase [Bacteroidia bacterium]
MAKKIIDVAAQTDAALKALKAGGVILYPTDTVWGLGCDATDPAAVARIYEIKRRSDSKSLVLLASDMDMVARYIKVIPNIAIDLVEVNDRPMTLIYPGAICGPAPAPGEALPKGERHHLAFNTVAPDGSVGIRIPMSEFCVELVRRFGKPIVSTSANISGEPAPGNFAQISPEILQAADYTVASALESGATGVSSQIIKVEVDGQVKIIRA